MFGFDNIHVKRDLKGRYILDDFEATNNYIIGRKEKQWLKKDGHEFLFKTSPVDYEMLSELISSELAQQCGFPVALYDFATYKGKVGVVTPNFLKKGEIINSGKVYLGDAADVAVQNNLNLNFSINSIDNILVALTINENLTTDQLEILLIRLLEIWCFDLAILESDRNPTNWGVIKTFDNIKISPIYDCSYMAKLNTNIAHKITNLRTESQIADLCDSIGYSLKYDNDENSNFYLDFEKACESFTDIIEEILYRLEHMDVYSAIKNIEDRINKDLDQSTYKIPVVIGIWIDKLISYRVKTMVSIFNKVVEKRNEKIKKLKK